MTIVDDHADNDQDEDLDLSAPEIRAAGRWNSAGVPGERSKDFKNALKRLGSMLGPMWIVLVFVAVVAVASATLNVFGPRVLGHGTDIIVRGVMSGHGIDFGALHHVLFHAVELYAASSVLSIIAAYTLAGVIQRLMFKLRSDVENKVNALPLSYIDRQQRGDLLSRVTNDIDNIGQTLQQSLTQLITALLTVIGVLLMMVLISPLLAFVSLLAVPLSIFVTVLIAGRSQKQFKRQWASTGALNGQVEEMHTGHAIVKVFGRQEEAVARFVTENDRLYDASYRAQFISGIIQPSMNFIANLNYVAIAVIGGLRVASGQMSLGDVTAFIQYSRQFTFPIVQTASIANVLQSATASAERVFELLDEPEEIADPARPSLIKEAVGAVTFQDVSFRYEPDKPLIDDLNLDVKAGQTIAIVGPTGAGKTTLVNLLMRFYEIDGGRITVDGVDTRETTRDNLRRTFGMVLQDTWLFHGTITENIGYGRETATEAEIVAAAEAAHVDHFVRTLPEGYDTVIDDDATNVSAGEKQLLTIARAFLADPPILILDEATSSVDTRTEVLIQRAMARLMKGRTTFVIAHRLSTIRDADTILVMDHGHIIEQGSHEQLLAAHGFYFDLYNSQFVEALAS